MKRVLTLILFAVSFINLNAQEFNVGRITVTTPNLQITDPEIFQNLEVELTDFFNTTRWTDVDYQDHERIRTTININITEELDERTFKADIAIQASRPIYGSNQETSLLTHADQGIVFEYEKFQQIEKSDNTYYNNLSSVISFYAYLILGLDYDSFSQFGGDPFFNTALNIVNVIPPDVLNVDKSWRTIDPQNNRYWIIENLTSPRVRPMRDALYRYHRQGLDYIAEDAEQAKTVLLAALEDIRAVQKDYSRAVFVQMFTN
ncbi:MAG: DUF4835 family protein, partial [Bacteroidota bacterium]